MPPLQAVFQPVMKVTGIETDDARFRIKAASGGFLAKLLGMGTASSLTVDSTGLRLKKSTFGGEEHTFIPRHQIASTVYVVQKPLELLILGLATLVMLVGIVFIIIYFFSKKRVIVGVISSGGTVESLKLKATADDLAEIKAGMAFVEQLLQVAGGGSAPPAAPPPTSKSGVAPSFTARQQQKSAAAAPPPPPPPPPSDGGTHIIACPSCSTQMSVTDATLGKKVRCVSCREVFRAEASA